MYEFTRGRIVQLAISPGGVPKLPVDEAAVGEMGLADDQHRGSGHGGPERAVCLFSLEVIERLQEEGHPITPGTAGENVTIAGLDWRLVRPGTRLQLGNDVLLEVTRYTTPCLNIASSFTNGEFARILDADHPGESRVYTRVVQHGTLRTGDQVQILEVPVVAR
ncbi:MAG TPA: MOSC domain-containing protein [Chloroflexota bacterium]